MERPLSVHAGPLWTLHVLSEHSRWWGLQGAMLASGLYASGVTWQKRALLHAGGNDGKRAKVGQRGAWEIWSCNSPITTDYSYPDNDYANDVD